MPSTVKTAVSSDGTEIIYKTTAFKLDVFTCINYEFDVFMEWPSMVLVVTYFTDDDTGTFVAENLAYTVIPSNDCS